MRIWLISETEQCPIGSQAEWKECLKNLRAALKRSKGVKALIAPSDDKGEADHGRAVNARTLLEYENREDVIQRFERDARPHPVYPKASNAFRTRV